MSVKNFLARIRGDIFAFAEEMNFRPTHLQRQFMADFQSVIHALQREVDPILRKAEYLRSQGDEKKADELTSVALAEAGKIKRRFAIRSGQGAGKGGCSTLTCMWFLMQWQGARVVVTAPTARQVMNVWIAEMGNRKNLGHPLIKKVFDIQSRQVGVFGQKPDQWGLTSFAASRPENAQGAHAIYQLIMIDEASGVDREILETIYGTSSGPMNLVVLAGNPNSRTCGFYDCFKPENEHLYHTYHWSCEMLPDSVWFSSRRAKEIEDEFGKDSDIYRVRVQGEWPSADPGSLLTEEDIIAVMDKKLAFAAARASNDKRIAMDFARYGGDENTCYRRRGMAVAEMWHMRNIDPSFAVAQGFAMQRAAGWSDQEVLYVADADGIGQGVVGRISGSGKRLYEYHNGGNAPDRRYYFDRITQAWFHFSKLVKAKKIYIPYDRQIITQATSRIYGLDEKSGLLRIETKKDYKTRTKLPSPDRMDTLVMLFDDNMSLTKVAI